MEKGWDKIFTTGVNSPEEKKSVENRNKYNPHYKRFVEGPIKTPELEKTPEEIQAIEDSFLAVNEMLEWLGLPKLEVELKRIHVIDPVLLSKDEMIQKSLPDRNGGEALKHIYIQRETDLVRFKWLLVHEMSHYASFHSLGIKKLDKPRHEDAKLTEKLIKILAFGLRGYQALNETNIYTRQAGLMYTHLHSHNPDESKVEFFGLNEAITEMFAIYARKFLPKRDMTDKEVYILSNTMMYYSQVFVLEKVIELLKDGDLSIEREEKIDKEILIGFIQGDYSFMRQLETKKKGIVKALREMGPSREDALNFATKMDFDDLIEKISSSLKKSGAFGK